MSDFDIIFKAMQRLRGGAHLVEVCAFSSLTESRLMTATDRGYDVHPLAAKRPNRTLFDIPVEIDPSLPVGEIRLKNGSGQVLRMVNIGTGMAEITKTRGAPVANFVPPLYYTVKEVPPDERLRMEFGVHFDRVEFSGTCETKQDLRDALRELLAELEAE